MIIVHVGLKRCGSASIQNFLSANQRPLWRLGVDYTRVGRQFRSSHANLAAELRAGEGFDSSLGTLSDLVKQWRASPGSLKVISTESFQALEPDEIATLKRLLDGVGEDARIVMVIRHLTGLLSSLYAQRVTRGQKHFDFDRFFELQMVKKPIDYFEISRPWGEVFGWRNIRICLLDAGAPGDGGLIDDFLTAVDVDPADPRLRSLVHPGAFNATGDWRVVEAIRALHKGQVRLGFEHPLLRFLARADRKFDQGCIERVAVEAGERRGWTGDRGSYLTQQQAQRCLDVYAAALHRLNEHLADRLPTHRALEAPARAERAFLPDANQIASADLRDFYDAMGETFARRESLETAVNRRWRQAGLIAGQAADDGAPTREPVEFPIVGGKRLVVHIGLKKSGSASIQNFLLANETVLRGLSIDYALVGRRKQASSKGRAPRLTAHHNLANEILGRKKFAAQAGSIAELRDYAAASDHGIIMISSEMFEGFEPRHIAKFHHMVDNTNRSIQIILVIRDLISLLQSSYAQKVRYGLKTHDFDAFCEERIGEARVDYFTTAKAWADVFGWGHISIRVLDRQYLANGDLIDDFLLTAGVKIDDIRVRAARRLGAVNESSGWRIIEATRALYQHTHGLHADHPLARFACSPQRLFDKRELERAAVEVGGRFGWLADKGLYLRRDHAQRAHEQFADSIARLNEYLPDPLPVPVDLEARGFLDRPFLPSAERIPAAERLRFYDEVADVRDALIAKRKALAKKRNELRCRIAARRSAREGAAG